MAGLFDKVAGFGADAAIDSTADGFINKELEQVRKDIPDGQGFVGQAMTTEVDQVANNFINNEVKKFI
ncbi:unnamed protein product [Didymodactylos carnosus]|uniref:Uncharacterized protein n=1 Tax=Didymodactylos carnosus TaxID=1234261 RepID=A0A813XE43_9BILA|nr:unnamed protein product [Didymodactylos carnosus]CAF1501844.1 unnamed protein product [Didymodactylos carnosus]CAF3656747.1 unnamed protein product [Didymodactylos carnosus]CAF4290309.1 unnamed protein product [Didymodactylos carnosus]